jgi:hypothetical protein
MKMWRSVILLLICLGNSFPAVSQSFRPIPNDESLPDWGKSMMNLPFFGPPDSAVWKIAHAYSLDRPNRPKSEQTYLDRYFRAWIRSRVLWGNAQASYEKEASSTPWSPLGPWTIVNNQGDTVAEHANVYSMAQGGGGVVYAGTEPGQVYRSTNYGSSWTLCALQVPFEGGIQALAANALDGSTVYAGTYNGLYRSVNGGGSWTLIKSSNSLNVNELLMHPGDTNVLFAATDEGLLRSSNRGSTWTTVHSLRTYDLAIKPGSQGRTVYAVGGANSSQNAQFLRSTDYGMSFQPVGNGWYQSNHPNRSDFGARLAVTPADTQRVYAYLIGESKPGDAGFIGVYKSVDGGSTWTLPNGPAGGPYSASHPNLAIGSPTWIYHQGFYNCALMANPNQANEILVGGLNLWKSTDGGATFSVQSGYAGGTLGMHVDQQDFRVFQSPTGTAEAWISTDGGIYRSQDFFSTPPQVRMHGMQATEFWGHGSGWNEDVFVAGAYHNGVIARRELYPQGDFLQLGGGEPASGYVNPFFNEQVISADIGGAFLPAQLGQSASYFGVQQFPNESYWPVDASNMVFDHRTPDWVFVGFQNKVLGSNDGGKSYVSLATFGTDPNHRIAQLAQAPNNPRVFYAVQRHGWNPATLHRSLDSGLTWSTLPIPGNMGTRLVFALSPSSNETLFLSGPEAPNGQKIWRSANGGLSWSNVTSPSLNGHEIRSILSVLADVPYVVVGTQSGVLYRADTSQSFRPLGTNLPFPLQTRELSYSYKHQKVRVSTYGRGLWSVDSPVPSGKPLARAQVEHARWALSGCGNDSIGFEDHSLVGHSGTTWSWTFPGGSPSFSNRRNPKVSYSNAGIFTARLIVLDSQGFSDTAWVSVEVSVPPALFAGTNFQSPIYPVLGLRSQHDLGAPEWQRIGWGNGEFAAMADNYNVDAQGKFSDLIFQLSASSNHGLTKLTFDRAYAPYGFPYSDTLQLILSANCDLNPPLWQKTLAGADLATAPAQQNGLFVPQSSHWVRDSVVLDSLLATLNLTGNAYFGFRNIGRWGQGSYLDNLVVHYTVGSAEISDNPQPYPTPNPVRAGDLVRFQVPLDKDSSLALFDGSGRPMGWGILTDNGFRLPAGASGVWTYRLSSGDRVWVGPLVVLP